MRMLIADDHVVVRRGVRALLSDEFPRAEFDEATTGEEAVAKVGRAIFDLVLLDLSMPGRGGLDALCDLKAEYPALPVLVFSYHSEEQYAIRALRAGASGYVAKSGPFDELFRAIRKTLSGGKYVTSSLAERLAESLGSDTGGSPHETLSNRELQVLCMLAEGRGVKDISTDLSLSDKTISTYRARILEKMNMKTTAELMRYALRANLVE